MLKIHRNLRLGCCPKRFYCLQTAVESSKNNKTYQHTILLPKTSFPLYFKPGEVVERDNRIQKKCKFLDCYAWQRKHIKGKEFVLHDGPPYANGKVHIGHAINKILKDIILRSQLIQGRRVHYIPGWDCHGLPIEMVAAKDSCNVESPIEIRKKAREIAVSMSGIQKEAFKMWGVLGDWDNQCYYTFDVKYIVNQLQMFWKMFEKGFIYYDFKPVYWSPSSRTALAEAELIYKNHISKAATVRFETTEKINSEPVYLLLWTTTPWTLPLNKAVFYSSKVKYSLVRIESFSGLYVIATDLIEDFQSQLQKKVTIHSEITSEELKKLKYKHPWNKDQVMNIYESSNIKMLGTGLLHVVPAHGHEDFIMGMKHNLKVESYVDEKGCYTAELGDKLAGLNVLEEGSSAIIQNLSSEIVLLEDFNHSYPYDWRTNKPVIIRASSQWFIDTNQLKDKALEVLNEIQVPLKYFEIKLRSRQYWCLSRQRNWGLPIPAFFHKKSKRPLLSKNLIHHLCHLYETSGPDTWWTAGLEELFPDRICRELFVRREDVIKGKDIMDIWFDSGISWSHVLKGKKSEVYIEGIDQYGGWFQSSLLTGVAVGGEAPFKRILTHGFAVDQTGRKMSKSLGNVVDPETVLKGENAFGVDVLRWWVGGHSQNESVPISEEILKSNAESVRKIRIILRFLLGALNNSSEEDVVKADGLQTVDTYMLNLCHKFYKSVIDSYNGYNFYAVSSQILFFISNEISARYVTVIKDRLYCDDINSIRRKACVYASNGILLTVCHAIAPILPHLAEEVFLHHPVFGGRINLFYEKNFWSPPESWKNTSADRKILLLDGIKKEISAVKNSSQMSCEISLENDEFQLLKSMQNGMEESIDSELTELLQVAEVRLKVGEKKVLLSPTKAEKCERCRRYTVPENLQLCARCQAVIFNLEDP